MGTEIKDTRPHPTLVGEVPEGRRGNLVRLIASLSNCGTQFPLRRFAPPPPLRGARTHIFKFGGIV